MNNTKELSYSTGSLTLSQDVIDVFDNARSRRLKHAIEVPHEKSEPSFFLPLCSAPSLRVPPHFVIPYHRLLPIWSISHEPYQWNLSCVSVNKLTCSLAFDLKFDQTWELDEVGIGDLASTLGLAPSEELTLQIQVSQRKIFDQHTVDTLEEVTSKESTTSDKSAINVVRAASRTQNWHIDGSGSVSLGSKLGVQVSGHIDTAVSESAQSSIQEATEATEKTSHALKSLHNIEVRTVSEETKQTYAARTVKNPYRDRTMSINVFEAIKRFSVETKLSGVNVALLIHISDIDFFTDLNKFNKFIIDHNDFLHNNLMDKTLIEGLPNAIRAIQSPVDILEAAEYARLALRYLFAIPGEEPLSNNIFNLPQVEFDISGIIHIPIPLDVNSPESSFQGLITDAIPTSDVGKSGFLETLNTGFGIIFLTLNMFYNVWREKNGLKDELEVKKYALVLARALAANIRSPWEELITDPQKEEALKNVLDRHDFTEVLRRLPGFLAIVSEMVNPLIDRLEDEEAAKPFGDQRALEKIRSHISCYKSYYISELVRHYQRTTKNESIVDFVRAVVTSSVSLDDDMKAKILTIIDPYRAYIDRQVLVVPGIPISVADILTIAGEPSLPASTFDDFADPAKFTCEVPADGVHLEVTEGACVLGNLDAGSHPETLVSELVLDLCKLMGQFQTILMQYKLPGIDTDKLIAAQQKNVEAIAEANRVSVEDIQALTRRQVEVLQESMKEASEAVRSLSKAGSPAELVAEQAELVKSAFEKSFAMMREITEILVKSSQEATDRVSAHIAATVEKIRSLGSSTK